MFVDLEYSSAGTAPRLVLLFKFRLHLGSQNLSLQYHFDSVIMSEAKAFFPINPRECCFLGFFILVVFNFVGFIDAFSTTKSTIDDILPQIQIKHIHKREQKQRNLHHQHDHKAANYFCRLSCAFAFHFSFVEFISWLLFLFTLCFILKMLHLLRCKLHAVNKYLNITLLGNIYAFTGIQSYIMPEERPLQMFSLFL